MSDSIQERMVGLEKENRRLQRKMKLLQGAYQEVERQKKELEEEAFKISALPSHYEGMEANLDYYKDMVKSLSLENSYLEERLTKGNFDVSTEPAEKKRENLFFTEELQEKVQSQKNHIEHLLTEKKQLEQELRVAKSEIAEVLIDAKIHARKIIQTADDESKNQRDHAKKEMVAFTEELKDVQQNMLQAKLDITQLFEEIDMKLSSIKVDLN